MKTRNLKNKALSILLAIVMLLGMLPMSVFAANTVNGVITLTPADLVDGASGEGWSFDGSILTIESGYTLVFDGECSVTVDNDGTISGGTFSGNVNNNTVYAVISNGTFSGNVTNRGAISNGTFKYTVDNQAGTISGGIFHDAVSQYGSGAVTTGGIFKSSFEILYGNVTGGIFAGTFKDTNNLASTNVTGITIELSNALIQGGESYGWSLSGNQLTLNSGITFYWKDGEVCAYKVINNGTITGGTFTKDFKNTGTITGGTFYSGVDNLGTIKDGNFFTGRVENREDQGTIEGGTFRNAVVGNHGTISDGRFEDCIVENYNTITGGSFYGERFNSGYGSTITGGSFHCTIEGINWNENTPIHNYGAEWKSDGTNHWHECEHGCGTKTDEAAHEGGVATCTEKAVCTVCEQPYGAVLGHNWGDWISDNNGTTHTRTCVRDASHTETENCSGGSATCTAKAECTVCSAEYGNLAEHTYGTEWKYDGTNHWHECTCGAKADSAAHSGGKATCTEKAECTVCGAEYGNLAAHTYGTEWKSDGANHWHECSCGAKSDEAAHNGGTATCKDKAACSVCGTAYGELAAHTYENGKCTVCKAADPNYNSPASDNPQTGDNSHMALWIVLLFISGGAVITLIFVERRKRVVNR